MTIILTLSAIYDWKICCVIKLKLMSYSMWIYVYFHISLSFSLIHSLSFCPCVLVLSLKERERKSGRKAEKNENLFRSLLNGVNKDKKRINAFDRATSNNKKQYWNREIVKLCEKKTVDNKNERHDAMREKNQSNKNIVCSLAIQKYVYTHTRSHKHTLLEM